MNQTLLDAALAFVIGVAIVVTVVGLQTIEEANVVIDTLTDYRLTTE